MGLDCGARFEILDFGGGCDGGKEKEEEEFTSLVTRDDLGVGWEA